MLGLARIAAMVSPHWLAAAWFAFVAVDCSGQTIRLLDVVSGDANSGASETSFDGTVVAGTSWREGGGELLFHSVRWTWQTGSVIIGSLPGGEDKTWVGAMSSDGLVIGGTSKDRPFVWSEAEGMREIGRLPGSRRADITGLSADGSIAVGWDYSTSRRGFRWSTTTGAQALPPLSGSGETFANTVSSDGSVTVGASGAPARAVAWLSNGTVVDLGVPLGGSSSWPLGANPDASVIVGASNGNYGGFRYTPPTGIQVISSPFPTRFVDVNDDGSVAVGSGHVAGVSHALLWKASVGVVDLNAFLPSLGVSLSGWVLGNCNAISGDGRTIVGTGTYWGQTRGWIATLAPRCVADFDGDNEVTTVDVLRFVSGWLANTASADFNRDGVTNTQDILDFVAAWFGGC